MSNFGPDSSAMPWLPGHIVSSSGPLSYIVQLPEGRTFRRHIYHIRKYTISYLELDHEQVTSSEFTEVVEPEETEVVSPVASSDSCLTQHGRKRQMSTAHSQPRLRQPLTVMHQNLLAVTPHGPGNYLIDLYPLIEIQDIYSLKKGGM